MTFKAMQGVDFKNMIFLVFWAKKLTIECAFKTDLAGFYMYPVATPYFTAKSDPLNNATNIDLFVPGCIVRFMPDGSREIIKFGDSRCP